MCVGAAASAQGPDGAFNSLGLNLPIGQSFIVEHRDQRRLPDGTMAQFHQELSLSFAASADNGVVATYRPVAHRCDGVAAICAAFMRQADLQPRTAVRFHINRQGRVSALDAHGRAGEPAGDAGDTGEQVASAIRAQEQLAPGAVMAADLRLLTRFANLPLPAPGQSVAVTEGRLIVDRTAGDVLDVRIDRAETPAQANDLRGRVECRVTRLTGLVERCRFTDWLGSAADQPLRIRDVVVRPANGPVS